MNRGKCNSCGREYALTQEGLVRRHRVGPGWTYADPKSDCEGSGKDPAPEMFPQHPELTKALTELEEWVNGHEGVELRFRYVDNQWRCWLPGKLGMIEGSGSTLAEAVLRLHFYWKELKNIG